MINAGMAVVNCQATGMCVKIKYSSKSGRYILVKLNAAARDSIGKCG